MAPLPRFASPFAKNIVSSFDSQGIRGLPVNSRKIKVMLTPDEFYKMLLTQISQAKQHITMSSLYLGTGDLERQLVSAVNDALRNNRDLKVQWFLDNVLVRGHPES